MANVAKYDRDEVIKQAMYLFWEKGFNATSTRDLQQAVNLRPGSFYAAFGSKEALFSEALKLYSAESGFCLDEALGSADSILNGIERFMKALVLDRRAKAPSEMCMLVKTIAELTDQHGELLEQSRGFLQKTEAKLSQLLHQAQLQQEISEKQDCDQLASFLMVQIMGLRTYLRSNKDTIVVERMIDDMFRNLRY